MPAKLIFVPTGLLGNKCSSVRTLWAIVWLRDFGFFFKFQSLASRWGHRILEKKEMEDVHVSEDLANTNTKICILFWKKKMIWGWTGFLAMKISSWQRKLTWIWIILSWESVRIVGLTRQSQHITGIKWSSALNFWLNIEGEMKSWHYFIRGVYFCRLKLIIMKG